MNGDAMDSDLSAPGRLETVRKFINTKDVESGADKFTDHRGLAAWLVDADLIDEAPEVVSSDDLQLSVEVREALRSLAAANHGTPLAAASLDVLNDAARAAGLQLSFSRDGAGIESSRTGVLGGLGHLLSIVAEAMNDGTWARLKVCMNEECAWAFFDHARNRSAKWCDMSVCGNRMKARAYRARRTGGTR
jgi:predicted RNA-binding Zn ribbon-like protein